MPRPLPNFNSGNRFTANVVAYFEVKPGVPYSIVGNGAFSGGTMTLSVYDGALDDFFPVTGGSWTDHFEDAFVSPFGLLRLELSGAGTPDVAVTFTPTVSHVHPQ